MSLNASYCEHVARECAISLPQVNASLKLLVSEEQTIPFVSRYRKEVTGGLDETQLKSILESFEGKVELEKRREYILESIQKQDKLTESLKRKIEKAPTLAMLEDLYAPYKQKRKSRGQKAIEAGLLPLALEFKQTEKSLDELATQFADSYLNPGNEINCWEDIVDGVRAILMEEIAHHVELKERLREDFWREATLKSTVKKDVSQIKESDKFQDYFDYEQRIGELKLAKNSHRFLAIRRAMGLKILKVDVTYPQDLALNTINHFFSFSNQSQLRAFFEEVMLKAYKLYILPALDLEIKSELKKDSDEAAIHVFGDNLKNLLLRPYLGPKAVLGIDPGVRTGCKVVVVDSYGELVFDTVIYPHEPKNDITGAKKVIETLLREFKVNYIAVGSGTFGRETLAFLKKHVEQVHSSQVHAMLVNEDGASIYSASDIARAEFPDKDVTVRGAVSIARRFQDPLAELVKIEPKSLGVGQYQHDVGQVKLKKSLHQVVESCVNYVGVDLNTASVPLLSYVSGIGPTLAGSIVKKRSELSGFKNREELKSVSRLSDKIFLQSAGFLRIYSGKNPLDSTFIHPERYCLIEKWCEEKKITTADLVREVEYKELFRNDQNLKSKLGEFTHEDIYKALTAPKQDPRDEFTPMAFREDIKSFADLKVGQILTGVITNITQFGAFVDIGIKENGLIHISQIADKFVSNPLEVLKVGQVVKPKIIELDQGRKRISLSLKSDSTPSMSHKTAKTAGASKVTKGAFSGLAGFKVSK